MIDPDENRPAMARRLGATDAIARDPVVTVIAMTDGEGVDVAMEAVGIPESFDVCQRIVRPGGHITNIGMHGRSVELRLEDLWIKNVTLRTGLVNTDTIPVLMRILETGGVEAAGLITHRFALDEVEQAYAVFSQAAKEKAVKVLLTAGRAHHDDISGDGDTRGAAAPCPRAARRGPAQELSRAGIRRHCRHGCT